MVFNPQYDLSRPLASALRAQAPFVGIPLPGHAPLIFNRLFLWRALKGVKPVHVAVQILEDGERLLIVDGVADERGRVRHHMKIRSLHRGRWEDRRAIEAAMDKWKPRSPNAPKISKWQAAIAKLQRQLDRLGARPKIANPCLACSHVPNSWRNDWLRWRAEKPLRAKIGALARQAHAGTLTAQAFYTALATLTTVRRFSDLNTRERRSLATRSDVDRERGYRPEGTYLDFVDPKNLWQYLPELLHCRPRIYGEDYFSGDNQEMDESGGRIPRWGIRRYDVVLEWSRARRELESQIAGIRQMEEQAVNE
jgi:hypothetical protein